MYFMTWMFVMACILKTANDFNLPSKFHLYIYTFLLMKTLSNKPLLAKIKTDTVFCFVGTLRKLKASSTTDIGAEGTTLLEPLHTKEKRLS